MTLEICVDHLESVAVCAAEGVDRIELCASLVDGGLTPSLGFLRAARRIFPGRIMAMLRPRGGDFLYPDGEFALMLDELELLRAHGADGIVCGMLTDDGGIDTARTRVLLDAAQGLDFTFHRAFDVSRDLDESLDALIALGVPRVLTSGGAPDVTRGMEAIAGLVKRAAGRIAILPGGGVTPAVIPALLERTGVAEVHLSARAAVEGPMRFRRDDLSFSPPGEHDHVRKTASAAILREARRAMESRRSHAPRT